MANHSIDCQFCGEDQRYGADHLPGCPGPAYNAAVRERDLRRAQYVRAQSERVRLLNALVEAQAGEEFDRLNPHIPVPAMPR